MDPDLSWGPADSGALIEFYGALPDATTRSVVVRMDGRTIGVIGAAIEGGHATLFSDVAPELEPYLRTLTVMRAVRAGITLAKGLRLPVFAFVEKDGGGRILEREGFVDHDEPGWKKWVPC